MYDLCQKTASSSDWNQPPWSLNSTTWDHVFDSLHDRDWTNILLVILLWLQLILFLRLNLLNSSSLLLSRCRLRRTTASWLPLPSLPLLKFFLQNTFGTGNLGKSFESLLDFLVNAITTVTANIWQFGSSIDGGSVSEDELGYWSKNSNLNLISSIRFMWTMIDGRRAKQEILACIMVRRPRYGSWRYLDHCVLEWWLWYQLWLVYDDRSLKGWKTYFVGGWK